MPIRQIAGTKLDYFLIMFDEDGAERPEDDGNMLSAAVRKRLDDGSVSVTDVFVMAHGWMGDATSAAAQFDRWTAAMLSVDEDIVKMNARQQGFTPLVVGLHWPSLPWGIEDASAAGTAVLSTGGEESAEIAAVASQLADTDRARQAIADIFGYASRAQSAVLTPAIVDAYAVLFHESQLRVGSLRGRPGSDQEGFDATSIVEQAQEQGRPYTSGQRVLGRGGIGGAIKDAILAPLRQLSFWKMKDRARVFGESGAHALLGDLQAAAPEAAFHLMGHSFGCIVISAMVAGPDGANASPLVRPVDSLFLVQGALSLWSYATDIPYAPGKRGYFQRILNDGRVRGPLITTRSTHDSAVGRFYPLGARLKGQFLLGEAYPEYGGIGAFGIRGSAGAQDLVMQTSDFLYAFENGCVYNLDASGVIKNGDGPAGAHSDIAHPEVAHAFWGAVLTKKATAASPASTMDRGVGAIPAPPPPPATQTLDADPPPPPRAPGGPAASAPKRQPMLLDVAAARREAETAAKITNMGADTVRRSVRILGTEAAAGGTATLVTPTTPDQPPAAGAAAAVAGSPPAAPAVPPSTRWVNADFEGIEPAAPLIKGNWYTLAFDVDPFRKATAQATAFIEEGVFAPNVDEVVLTVQLDTQDFDISGRTSQMRVPRVGKAHTKARFDVSPLKDGPSTMKATILKDGNFIQQMDLSFDIGQPRPDQPDEIPSRGRAFGSAGLLQSRDLGLLIKPSDGGYDCTVWGAVAASAHLPITPAFLDDAIRVARSQLMQVVMQRDAAGNYVFQSDEPISKDATALALKTMSFAGALLLQKLFYGPGAGLDSKDIGDVLRRLAGERTSRLKLQIIAESLPVPWGLLYMGDVSDPAKLDWDNFLGMRHVIEQIPLQNPMRVTDRRIRTDPVLAVSVNLNDDIDTQMQCDFVKQQRDYWRTTERINVIGRTTSAELVAALNDVNNADQILYFYGHAGSNGLTDPGGPGGSSLALTDGVVTLDELTLRAPANVQLSGSPLVFINACESAEMSPMFYDGFAPYFMSKGARGVIGTECKTPAYFAMSWARHFFDIFLKGAPLGEAFLDLRRKFLTEEGNPLGLLYAVHCNADTAVDPAL